MPFISKKEVLERGYYIDIIEKVFKNSGLPRIFI